MRATGLLEAVNRRNVGMIQRSENLRLALESLQTLFVLGERLGQDLDRYVPTEFFVLRSIHLAHATFANGLDDDVVGELVTSS